MVEGVLLTLRLIGEADIPPGAAREIEERLTAAARLRRMRPSSVGWRRTCTRRCAPARSPEPAAAAKCASWVYSPARQRTGPSRVLLKLVEDRKRETVHDQVRKHVEPGADLNTDAYTGYLGLDGEYVHGVVDHAVKYAEGNVHTNGMENFWSLLKRTIKGTYVSVDPVHLTRYLDEQSFRFNERGGNDQDRFMRAASQVAGKRLTYAELIRKDDDTSVPLRGGWQDAKETNEPRARTLIPARHKDARGEISLPRAKAFRR